MELHGNVFNGRVLFRNAAHPFDCFVAPGYTGSSSNILCSYRLPVHSEEASLNKYFLARLWYHHPLGFEHSVLYFGNTGHSKQNSPALDLNIANSGLLSNN